MLAVQHVVAEALVDCLFQDSVFVYLSAHVCCFVVLCSVLFVLFGSICRHSAGTRPLPGAHRCLFTAQDCVWLSRCKQDLHCGIPGVQCFDWATLQFAGIAAGWIVVGVWTCAVWLPLRLHSD